MSISVVAPTWNSDLSVSSTAPVELHDKSEFQIGATTLMLIVTDDA